MHKIFYENILASEEYSQVLKNDWECTRFDFKGFLVEIYHRYDEADIISPQMDLEQKINTIRTLIIDCEVNRTKLITKITEDYKKIEQLKLVI